MAGTKKIPLGQQKDVVRNVISFIKIADIDTDNLSDSVEADILAEYIKNDDFQQALRCVCIDNDIQNSKWQSIIPDYNVNNTEVVLDNDDEIKIFWSVISADELLKQSIIHFQNAL